MFESAGAAVAGGLIGGLTGGIVGRALESQSKDYSSTARDYNYSPAQGTVVRIEEVQANPSRVNAPDTVHLVARYALLPPEPDREVTVRERWRITHNGELVGNPVITVPRSGGTWASAVPLQLPAGAEDGRYRASVEVSVEEAGGSGGDKLYCQLKRLTAPDNGGETRAGRMLGYANEYE